MAEYISREKIAAEARELSTHLLNEWDTLGVLALIDRQPAANVAEVRHGHWIEWADGEGDTFECSVCGEPWTLNAGTPEENNMHYCPNCGARMAESEDENDV